MKIWGQGLKPWRGLSPGSVGNEKDSAQSWRANCPQVLKFKKLWAGLKKIEKEKIKLGPEEKSSEQQERGKIGIFWRKFSGWNFSLIVPEKEKQELS